MNSNDSKELWLVKINEERGKRDYDNMDDDKTEVRS